MCLLPLKVSSVPSGSLHTVVIPYDIDMLALLGNLHAASVHEIIMEHTQRAPVPIAKDERGTINYTWRINSATDAAPWGLYQHL